MAENTKKFKISGKLKTFLLAASVALASGVTHFVQKKAARDALDKQTKEWYNINAGADSISISPDPNDPKKTIFYAEKRVDSLALKKAIEKRDSLLKQRNAIIAKANEEFSAALKKLDVKGMRLAYEKGADNKNTPNEQGQTPLMQALAQSNTVKGFLAARFLIDIHVNVDVKDNKGATASDYASKISGTKGATLQKGIKELEGLENDIGEPTAIDDEIFYANQEIYDIKSDWYKTQVSQSPDKIDTDYRNDPIGEMVDQQSFYTITGGIGNSDIYDVYHKDKEISDGNKNYYRSGNTNGQFSISQQTGTSKPGKPDLNSQLGKITKFKNEITH